jgi:myosin heavy subunit
MTDPESAASLSHAAELLGLDGDALRTELCSRILEVRGTRTRVPLDSEQAHVSLHSLAKRLYGTLFDWLVRRVNISMEPVDGGNGGNGFKAASHIGILDIFGFEIFEKNSFEQVGRERSY